jgi:BirA family transcriptional regulator, biotin operon repressor / biotin---[acetyl-CoA-carboxylase] ligase
LYNLKTKQNTLYKIPATPLFLGKNLIFMPECHSTNDALLLLCQREPAPEGTLVITAHQTAGRGQRGNSWEAQPGMNLTFSLLLKPTFLEIQKQFFLNVMVSLGIRDYLTRKAGTKVHIKWPNDILVQEKKICGVLIENQLTGKVISNSVVGIGLNVNQQQFDVPAATSIARLTNSPSDLSDELDELVHTLEVRYLQLKNMRTESMIEDYLQNLFLLGAHHRFSDRNGDFDGRILGIDDIGRLRVERNEGVFSYDLKEISYHSQPTQR